MGWSIGEDKDGRDIGYGVPALCDHPACNTEIHRGISYVCGGEPYGGDRGCGLHFCTSHLLYTPKFGQLCERCYPRMRKPFTRKPDVREWVEHKLTDESWAQWRAENQLEVAAMKASTVPPHQGETP
jgi:hypothetical protein